MRSTLWAVPATVPDPFFPNALTHIRPIVGRAGEYHVFPSDNLCIEWNRSIISADKKCHYGRCHLPDRKNAGSEAKKRIRQVMSDIAKFVKVSSPRISVLSPPVFVGPDLTHLIEKGTIQGVVYRGGSIMDLRSNPFALPKRRGRHRALRAFGKKGSGTVAGTAQRVLRTTVPDPFVPNAPSGSLRRRGYWLNSAEVALVPGPQTKPSSRNAGS